MDLFFKKIKFFLDSHWLIMFLALSMSFLVSSQTFFFPILAGKEYKGINIAHFGGDAHYYLTRGKEVLDGNSLGSVVLKENKDGIDLTFSNVEKIIVNPIRWLGLQDKISIVTLYNFYIFFGVFIIIFLIYLFVFQISLDKRLAILSAVFVVGGYSIVFNKNLFFTDFNFYGRMVYPICSSIPFFLFLNFLFKCLKSNLKRYITISAIIFGLMFYTYFFAWSFSLALLFSLFLIYFIKKDFLVVKRIFAVLSFGILIGSYNLWKIFSLGQELSRRTYYFSWALHSREFVWSTIGFLMIILFAWYLWKAKNNENWPIILASIVSFWVALNQQIFTGRLIQYGHYYWYFIVPLAIIFGFFMLWEVLPWKKCQSFIFVFFTIIAFLNTGIGQLKSVPSSFEKKIGEQRFSGTIDILNNLPQGVVLANTSQNSSLIPILTKDDLFWLDQAFSSSVPIERAEDALLVFLFLNKESREDPISYLKKMLQTKTDNFFTGLYKSLEGYFSGMDYFKYLDADKNKDGILLEKRSYYLEKLSNRYFNIFLNKDGIFDLFRKYSVKYVLWDKKESPEWDLGFIKTLKLLNKNDDLYLYSIR